MKEHEVLDLVSADLDPAWFPLFFSLKTKNQKNRFMLCSPDWS